MTGSPIPVNRFIFPLFTLLEGLEQLPIEVSAGLLVDSGRIQADGASMVRLNRLFDIFFESHWFRHAGLTEVALTATLTGKVRIDICRRNALDGQEESVASVDLEGQGQAVEIAVPLRQSTQDEEATYLFAIVYPAAETELRDLRWCAAVPPVRQVRIAGVICTYNREEMLARNLERFNRADSFLHRLFVVNQGPEGLAARLSPETGAQADITFIDQPNLGGAGGFTRGIVESLSDAQATHILLMDDDIIAVPSLLARMAVILSYGDERHCIGGAMLDLYDPRRVFTCGDRLNPDRPAIIHVAPAGDCTGDDDVTKDAGRDFVARHHQVDFNGWWCFAFPVEAARQCGLPLPLFIRGDDVEYGVRLSRAGFPTIVWPGVAVWHMPFAPKAQPWQAFYDRRNMLFLCEAHGLFSRRRLARSAWGSFRNALQIHDYARAEAIIRGVDAFNQGPSHLESWSGDDHAMLLRDMAGVGRGGARGLRHAVQLSMRAVLVVARLRWGRPFDPDTVLQLARTDRWHACLKMSLHDGGFANASEAGIAHSRRFRPN